MFQKIVAVQCTDRILQTTRSEAYLYSYDADEFERDHEDWIVQDAEAGLLYRCKYHLGCVLWEPHALLLYPEVKWVKMDQTRRRDNHDWPAKIRNLLQASYAIVASKTALLLRWIMTL